MESLVKGFKENKAFRFTSLLVVLLLAITLLAPVIAPYDPLSAVMKDANQAPSAAHLFGTDKLGRDVLSRILYGASYSLTSVIALVACIFVVGTTMGIISGYFGGIVDIVIMRIADADDLLPGRHPCDRHRRYHGRLPHQCDDRTDCGHMDQVCPPLPFHGPQDQAP